MASNIHPNTNETPAPLRWNVLGVRLHVERDNHDVVQEPGLVGILTVADINHALRVDVMTPLLWRGDAVEADWSDDMDRLAELYGRWCAHAMWDFAAQHGRLLLAGVLSDMRLPAQTPPIEIGQPE